MKYRYSLRKRCPGPNSCSPVRTDRRTEIELRANKSQQVQYELMELELSRLLTPELPSNWYFWKRLIFCSCQSQDMDVLYCYLSWPPCVGIRQFARLLPSLEVIVVSPTICVSNFYVQLLTYVMKTNIYMQMLTYLIPVSESRFMWSHNQSNLPRWHHYLQKWEEIPVSKRDGRLEKKNWSVRSVKIISFMGDFVYWNCCCAAHFCVWKLWDIYHQLRKNGRALNLHSIAEFLQMTRCLWPPVRWI